MKVQFAYRLDEEMAGYESLWVSKAAGGYIVDNIPFFVKNIACGDVISVEEDDGIFYFEDLIRASGHSTVRITLFDTSVLGETKNNLLEKGCSWESMKSNLALLAVDIPPEVEYDVIREYLKDGQDKGLWDYQEACLGWK